MKGKVRGGVRPEKGRRRYLAWRQGQPISWPLPPERRRLLSGGRWFHVREIHIYADASVRPGPWGWPGIGFALYTHRGHLIEAQSREGRWDQKMGINTAETYAAAIALRRMRSLLGPGSAIVHTDSDWVMGLLNRHWSPSKVGARDAWKALKSEIAQHQWVDFVKVPRDHPNLRIPDALSKEAATNRKRRAEARYSGCSSRTQEGPGEQSERSRMREKRKLRQRRSLTI